MTDRTESTRFHAQMIQELARQLTDEPMSRKHQKGVFKIIMTTCNKMIAWSTFTKSEIALLQHQRFDLEQSLKLLEKSYEKLRDQLATAQELIPCPNCGNTPSEYSTVAFERTPIPFTAYWFSCEGCHHIWQYDSVNIVFNLRSAHDKPLSTDDAFANHLRSENDEIESAIDHHTEDDIPF